VFNDEVHREFDSDLAEKCKKALENAYGFKIPLPACFSKNQEIPNSTLDREGDVHKIGATKEHKNPLEPANLSESMPKTTKLERLSSEEFSKQFSTIWKQGPAVKYAKPDSTFPP
jgi:hypothetical protein